jgi:cold shock CspA family protein
MVQRHQGVRLHRAAGRRQGRLHITAVQKAGLQGLKDNQKVEFEVAMERGKAAAINLKPL